MKSILFKIVFKLIEMKKILYIKFKSCSSENKVTKDEMDFFSGEYRILTIKTTSIPENGKADESVLKILSNYLGVSKTKIKIISGTGSKEKKKLNRPPASLNFHV
jgi:uncharacterized protein YggU (UPF0235/DUF167 family)